jgi:hypothetical protein
MGQRKEPLPTVRTSFKRRATSFSMQTRYKQKLCFFDDQNESSKRLRQRRTLQAAQTM